MGDIVFVCGCCALTAVHRKPCGDPDHACTLAGDFMVLEVIESIDHGEPHFACDGCGVHASMTMYALKKITPNR